MERTKQLLSSDEDEEVKASFRSDLKKITGELKEVEQLVVEKQAQVVSGKVSMLTHQQFLELMEKLPKTLRQIKNMTDLDFALRKMFLNFTVKGKSVAKATLSSPFAELSTIKIHECGGEEN